MEKLPKYDLDELMEILKDELSQDSMPWYWSVPVYAPSFNWTVYSDNLDKMAQYMVNKYS